MANVTPCSSKCQQDAIFHLLESDVQPLTDTTSQSKLETTSNVDIANSFIPVNRTVDSFADKSYQVRPGTVDEGKDYEFKMAALLSLRCIRRGVEDMWMVMNADGIGDFDDIVLHIKEVNREGTTIMLQLKHKVNTQSIPESEFLRMKGDFALQKYFISIRGLSSSLTSNIKAHEFIKNLGTFNTIYFVLFTNASVDNISFLEKYRLSDLKILITNSKRNMRKLNLKKLPDSFPFGKDVPPTSNLYMFSNQEDTDGLEKLIEKEIREIVGNSASLENVVEISKLYVAYITKWAKGKLGSHFYLTKNDVFYVLTELFLSRYIVDFRERQPVDCDKSNVILWKEITTHRSLTLSKYNATVLKLLISFINKAMQLLSPCIPISSWNDQCDQKESCSAFHFQIGNFTEKYMGRSQEINPLVVYKYLWKNNELPLILKAEDTKQYESILNVLNLSGYSYKTVILYNQDSLPMKNEKDANRFETLADLDEKYVNEIITRKIKVQGRLGATLNDFVREHMFQYISCADIVNILFGSNFNIGNKLESLPEEFMGRTIMKTVIKPEILANHRKALFVIEDKIEMDGLPTYDIHKREAVDTNHLNALDSGIINVEREIGPRQLLKLKVHRPVHILSVYDRNYFHLKWSSEISETIDIFRTQTEYLLNKETVNSFLKYTTIIEAVPGMGKTLLMNYVASVAPVDFWVIKIDLNRHQFYFRRNSRFTDSEKHLKYFYTKICEDDLDNSQLCDKVFENLLALRKIVVLLDGFDEIAASYKEKVTKMAASLRQEGYAVCITTRPLQKSRLEIAFGTTSDTIKPFGQLDQKNFLVNYFNKVHANLNIRSKMDIIQDFVDKMLQRTRKNLNDRDSQFTGIPLQTQLLANVFSAECEKCILSKSAVNLSLNFDLLYLYENYIEHKMEVFLKKYGESCYVVYKHIKRNQAFFALKLVFAEFLEETNVINQACDSYLKEIGKREELEQLGIMYVDENFNISCVHRTIAEYLSAKWLLENVAAEQKEIKAVACTLIKTRFSKNYDFLFYIFDKLASKGFPLHTAILNDHFIHAMKILRENSNAVSEIDAAGRSALHIAALRSVGLNFQRGFGKFPLVIPKRSSKSNIALNYIIQLILHSDAAIYAKKDQTGYDPLNYALACCSLETANKIQGKVKATSIIAYIDLRYRLHYLYYCMIHNYNELTALLLPYFISRDLLLKKEEEGTSLKAYMSFLYYKDERTTKQMQDFICNYQYATLGQVFNSNLVSCYTGCRKTLFWRYYDDLRYAIAFGNYYNVRSILRKQISLNEQDLDGNMFLTYAVLHNKVNIIEILLRAGASINKQNSDGCTPLHKAAELGYLKITSLIIKRGAEINIRNNDGNTALHLALAWRKAHTIEEEADLYIKYIDLASQRGQTDTITVLIKNGADLNIKNNDGNTALHLSSEWGHADTIAVLAEMGADFNIKNNDGDTPLHLAANWCHTDKITVLIEKGADLNIKNNDGNTALHLAVKWQKSHTILVLAKKGALYLALKCNKTATIAILAKNGADLNIKNNDGDTVLHLASRRGHTDIIAVLIENGADLNIKDNDGHTALHLASELRGPYGIAVLLEKGANLNITNNDGDTALHLASKLGGYDRIAVLADKGADLNIRNNDGNTALHLALKLGHIHTIGVLIEKGADSSITNDDGDTALHLASKWGQTDTVPVLIKEGIDVNVKNNDGDTALHLASKLRGTNGIKVLIEKGADLNIKNNDGNTALHFASKWGQTDTIVVLIDKGADLNIKNNDGNTALHFASKSGHTDAVLELLRKGADSNIKNNDGNTTLHLASKSGQTHTIGVLIVNGADLNIKNNDGSAALHLASKLSQRDTVAVLVEES